MKNYQLFTILAFLFFLTYLKATFYIVTVIRLPNFYSVNLLVSEISFKLKQRKSFVNFFKSKNFYL